MDDSYLKIFERLFFNVEENEKIKSIIEQASSVLASVLTKYGEIENEISCGSSRQKIMEQLDAINVLFSVGLFAQTQILLRSLIENTVGLEFILKEDTEKRAAAYYLERHYKDIELGVELFDKNSEYRKLVIENRGEKQYNNDYKKYKKKKRGVQAFSCF